MSVEPRTVSRPSRLARSAGFSGEEEQDVEVEVEVGLLGEGVGFEDMVGGRGREVLRMRGKGIGVW